MLRVGGLLVEAGNFSDLGDLSLSPHRHSARKTPVFLPWAAKNQRPMVPACGRWRVT